MLTREQMVEKLKDRKIRVVCRAIGVAPASIYRIIAGKAARYETMEKLSKYLSQ